GRTSQFARLDPRQGDAYSGLRSRRFQHGKCQITRWHHARRFLRRKQASKAFRRRADAEWRTPWLLGRRNRLLPRSAKLYRRPKALSSGQCSRHPRLRRPRLVEARGARRDGAALAGKPSDHAFALRPFRIAGTPRRNCPHPDQARGLREQVPLNSKPQIHWRCVMTVPTFLPYFIMAGTTATFIAIIYGLQRSFAA